MLVKPHTMAWCVSISAAAVMMATPALAQKGGGDDAAADVLPPTYGVVTLETGFLDDPFGVALQAGGNMDASSFDPSCWGNVAEAPDVALDYTAGDQYPLNIYVDSNDDPTLMVLDPSGNYTCNDDFNGLQPGLIYDNPESGRYNIWVGTYSSGSFPDATLLISEVFTSPAEAAPIFGPIAEAQGGDGMDDQSAEPDSDTDTDAEADQGADQGAPPAGAPDSAFAMFEMGAQMAGDMMSYASAQPIGDNGFEVIGLSLNPPEGGGPITIETLRVEEMDWQAALADEPPAFLNATIEGLHIPDLASIPDMDNDAIQLLGEELTMNFAIDYAVDGGSLMVDTFNLDLVDLMQLDMTMDIGNVDLGGFASAGPMAMMGATINSASLDYTDAGFAQRALDMGAAESGMQTDQMIQMGTMQLQGMGGMITSEGGQAALEALLAFMGDLPNPSGTLSVDVAPPTPVNAMALMSLANPDAAVETLGLTVTYE